MVVGSCLGTSVGLSSLGVKSKTSKIRFANSHLVIGLADSPGSTLSNLTLAAWEMSV